MSTTSETPSIYFDAPLAPCNTTHSFDLAGGSDDPLAGSAVNGHTRQPTPKELATDKPHEGEEPANRARQPDPIDVVYLNGHWVERPASTSPGDSTPSTVSPDPLTLSKHKKTHTDGEAQFLPPKSDNNWVLVKEPVTKGPTKVEQSLERRAASADASLTPKQKSKIVKKELKESKQLSKVIENEGKIDREAVAVAIKELSELQAIHKAAVKAESKAHTAKALALAAVQRYESEYHAARTRYESAKAELAVLDVVLDTNKRNARGATDGMQEKMREVELLRVQKGADDREREVKLVGLTGRKSTLKKWL